MSKRKRIKSTDSPFLSPLSSRLCIEAPSEVGMWAPNEPKTVDRNNPKTIQTRSAIRRLSLDNTTKTAPSVQLKPTPEISKANQNKSFPGFKFDESTNIES